MLAAEKKKLKELWASGESNFVHRITLAQRTCLSAFVPDTIRRAAREFSTHTATSTAGFAVRHFALLSDDALTLASQFCEVSKAMAQAWENLHLRFFFLRPGKDEQSPTQFGDMRPRWCAVLTEARKQSQFGGTLHSSMSAWNTTSSKPTQKLSVSLCLSFEMPCQPTECNAYWSSMARQPPTKHPSRGVVVGSAIATYLVKLYGLLVFGQCCAAASFG